ncbi:hypothetical protein HDU98_010106 [Podochytrium sp. JEL0797]|nr:hypothetical protein HDU98_010106 [Podochytrium sp. JEL0797]
MKVLQRFDCKAKRGNFSGNIEGYKDLVVETDVGSVDVRLRPGVAESANVLRTGRGSVTAFVSGFKGKVRAASTLGQTYVTGLDAKGTKHDDRIVFIVGNGVGKGTVGVPAETAGEDVKGLFSSSVTFGMLNVSFISAISFLEISTTSPSITPVSGMRTITLTNFGICSVPVDNKTPSVCSPFQLTNLFQGFSLTPSMIQTATPPPMGGSMDPQAVILLLPFTTNPITFIALVTELVLGLLSIITLSITISRHARGRNQSALSTSKIAAFITTLAAFTLTLGFLAILITSNALNALIVQRMWQFNITSVVGVVGNSVVFVGVVVAWGASWGVMRVCLVMRVVEVQRGDWMGKVDRGREKSRDERMRE